MPHQVTASERRRASPDWAWILAAALTAAALLAVTIWLTTRKTVTDFELGLLQFILFAAGTLLTFWFGRRSVRAEAEDMIRRDGRKSVRRIVNLANGIQEFGGLLNSESARVVRVANPALETVPLAVVEGSFNLLQSHVPGQLRTITDAIEDWRDIVPEEVADLERRAEAQGQDEHQAGEHDG